ncbi:HAMP domain-containing histidine kinase [Streptacidiphilus sp. 4-A2]|nr:HAMP domain-containing histidine kinase [Streptacidiphilus sp. 4-A2]
MRLLCLTVALVAVGLVVSDALVLNTVQPKLVSRVDQQVTRMARLVENSPGQRPPAASAGPPTPSGRGAEHARELTPGRLGRGAAPSPAPTSARCRSRSSPRTGGPLFTLGHWRLQVVSVAPDTDLVFVGSLAEADATGSNLIDGFWAIGLVVLLLVSVIGWFAVRTGLKPLEEIETTATEIAAGHPLSNRMPEASHRTEVGRLSASLNSMLEQIEAAFAARAASENRMRAFVADASHELRTPLAGIRGFAELYRMGALSEDADIKRTMTRIESEAVRMGGLVEDLLTLARLDEQRPIELAPMDLRTLAADALHDTTALDPTRPVSLTGPGGSVAPAAALVLGDEARLRQVVTNLVGNAVRHTPPGTPVRIGVGTVAGYGVIEVADQGPGLTPEQATRVFERFYRVDASRSRQEGGGAGLGLAIVSALVSAHSGDVQVESAPGAGALFRVRLPSTSRFSTAVLRCPPHVCPGRRCGGGHARYGTEHCPGCARISCESVHIHERSTRRVRAVTMWHVQSAEAAT